MTYNEKRSLYESIMKDVAIIVKQRLNENNNTEDLDKRLESATKEVEKKIENLKKQQSNDNSSEELSKYQKWVMQTMRQWSEDYVRFKKDILNRFDEMNYYIKRR